MKRLVSLALVLTALLLVMLPVRASSDVYTDENFSSSGGLDGVEVVAGNVRLRVTPEHWTQTTKADFEQWESHENVTAVDLDYVKLESTGEGWSTLENAPYSSTYCVATAGAGDYLFILRGYWAGVKVGIGRYNTATGSWENWSDPTIEWQEKKHYFKNGCSMAWDNCGYIYVLAGGSYNDTSNPSDPTTHEPRYGFWRFSVGNPSIWERLENTPWHQGPGDALVWARGNGEDYIYAWIGTTSKNRGRGCGAKFYRYDVHSGHWDPNPITEIEKLYYNNEVSPPYGADDGSSLAWTGGDYIYFLPGAYAENLPPNKERYFARFVISENRWKNLAMLPHNENPDTVESDGVDDGGSMVWDGGDYLYFLKGGDGNGDDEADNFWRYSISLDSWEVLAGVPFGPSRNNGRRLGYAGENVYYWHANSTGFWAYTPPRYGRSGYFTSSVFDAGVVSTWQRMSFEFGASNGATLRVWTRSSSDDVKWSGWVENQSGDVLPWENRYLQYRVEFSTNDEYVTPILHEMRIAYLTKIWRTGTFTSQPLELGYVENWGTLSWEATLPENTSISFATRSSADGSTWSEWAELDSNAIQSPTRDRPFLQVRASLRGLGAATPTLRSYSISYTTSRALPIQPIEYVALVVAVGVAGIAAAGVARALSKGARSASGGKDDASD